ncbi:amino acid adenylation domain-containing protein [Streptomyces europaeiscabiei]|uniref:amino acid adenylation domain-containing protein n=1 Tax=Streptomyces europaeiscabiei TaxID=146819 RepID=UPI0029AD0EBE|nr:amino acid adenylation domain-containing protein [Streptomyces europaeiscabiei]MDX2525277.1 amino acid adenylation domain-containing protein [Streptomyces europaeiscabiei]
MEGLHTLVSDRAQRSPDATAIVDESGALTYGELDAESNRIARVLRGRGLRPDDRVCLLVPKSAPAVVVMLGVLKAGGVYIPLDGAGPSAHIAKTVKTSEPQWMVVHPKYAHHVDELRNASASGSAIRTLLLDAAELAAADSTPVPTLPTPSRLAYIIFTSGSTGVPKGVQITHDSVAHFSGWLRKQFGIAPGDRLSGHPPFHFDLSVLDIYGALTNGAQLHIVPEQANLLPRRTADFIRDSQLTQWTSVPSTLIGMEQRDVVRPGDFPHLRRVLWCGDVLPTSVAAYWMRRLPHVTFVNLYGPTETTVASSFYVLPTATVDQRQPLPIGRAIPGERLGIFRPDRSRAAVGEVGDLCIAGAGLSPGYWRDPERTSRAFAEIPTAGGTERWYVTGDFARVDETGFFHFHGRSDRQVKSRGYRIELDEVTAAVNELPDVAESTIVALPVSGMEGRRLHAACVLRPGVELNPAALRDALLKHIPAYMVPTRWHSLEEIPRTSNGKADHAAVEKMLQDQ